MLTGEGAPGGSAAGREDRGTVSGKQDDMAKLGYEAARDELVEVVRSLEAGGRSLEESLALWERGEALAKVCERHLAGARERVETALASVESLDAEAENGTDRR